MRGYGGMRGMQRSQLLQKIKWCTIGCRLRFDYVRNSTSMADFEHRKLMVESILTAEDIEDLREALISFQVANATNAKGKMFLIFRYTILPHLVTFKMRRGRSARCRAEHDLA
eukprot:gene17634-21005_t